MSLLIRSISGMLLLSGFTGLPASVLASPPATCQLNNPVVPDQEVRVQRLNQLHVQIQRLVGTPFARTLSQCKTMAIGSKACGGPGGYLVYSALITPNEAKLRQLVFDFTKLQQQLQEEWGLISDCLLEMPPEIDLVNGICTARSPNSIQPLPQTTPPTPDKGEDQE